MKITSAGLIPLIGICTIMSQNSYALDIGEIGLCNVTSCAIDSVMESDATNCARYTDTCYKYAYVASIGDPTTFKIRSCTACGSGYKMESRSVSVSGCKTYTYNTCVASIIGGDDCDGTCDNCESTDWTTIGVRQVRTIATCNTDTCFCAKRQETRCLAGYYGTGGLSLTGPSCTECPSPGTSTVVTTQITGCYITGGSDSTGSYSFSPSPCYYSN